MREYPQILGNGLETLLNWAKRVTQDRINDIGDFDKLPELYAESVRDPQGPDFDQAFIDSLPDE